MAEVPGAVHGAQAARRARAVRVDGAQRGVVQPILHRVVEGVEEHGVGDALDADAARLLRVVKRKGSGHHLLRHHPGLTQVHSCVADHGDARKPEACAVVGKRRAAADSFGGGGGFFLPPRAPPPPEGGLEPRPEPQPRANHAGVIETSEPPREGAVSAPRCEKTTRGEGRTNNPRAKCFFSCEPRVVLVSAARPPRRVSR